jgi:hypothetical protein
MPAPLLEEVFKKSGLPTYTFVEPAEYNHLKVALRTAGRGVVVEGPSGIGKTTAVQKALTEIGIAAKAQVFSGRNAADRELLAELPAFGDLGIVIIDDFHRLSDATKHVIADLLKEFADKETTASKIVLIGINRAGDSLVNFAPDLNNRIETIHFEVNTEPKVRELIKKGEEALNITIECADALARDASGSFHMAQILCNELCLHSDVSERTEAPTRLEISFEAVKARVLTELSRTFRAPAIEFARGRRFYREGRAPYLHLLANLSRSDEWTISISDILAANPHIRGSLSQVTDKGHLETFLKERPILRDLFHYDPYTRVLAVEDPKIMYYLRNILWSKFVREAGFLSIEFQSKYDFALSFAGEVRHIAEIFNTTLKDAEMEVFYDKDEEHRIMANDVEAYLAPIYRTEARFVIVLLSSHYPRKIWTKFESEQFKQRFGEDSVIPIWFSDAPPGMFDTTARLGGSMIDVTADLLPQIARICDVLVKKVGEERLLVTQAAEHAEDENGQTSDG